VQGPLKKLQEVVVVDSRLAEWAQREEWVQETRLPAAKQSAMGCTNRLEEHLELIHRQRLH
jgi:hypothetical protein